MIIEKQQLVRLVSAYQERTYAEEIQLLCQQGNDISWIEQGLDTHQKRGISVSSIHIQQRKKRYGTNEKYAKKLASFFQLFKDALDDFTLKILIVASIGSIAIEVGTASDSGRKTAWIEGFVVMVAVVICASVTAINNYSKQRQFQKLNTVADQRKRVTVRRNGELIQIHQDLVLVGDIVNVQEGMQIPADAILVQSNEITTDQSAMTGETDPISKNILQNCLKKKREIQLNGEKNTTQKHEIMSPIMMSGTKVLTGEGKMMIIVVGQQSCIGKIRALLSQQEQVLTPLQEKLEKMAQNIGKLGLYSALSILIILIVRFSIQKGISKTWDNSVDLKQLLDYFILAITVVVVAIPEGLPLSVTLSLAVSVKQMLDDNNLVRRLQACETMGGANNICSDKTGTLTMNKMTLTNIWNGHTRIIDTSQEQIDQSKLSTSVQFLQLFKIAACVNSTANLQPEEKGSSTQIAILKYMKKIGVNYNSYREKYQSILKYPFSSARKRMSVLTDYHNQYYLFVKGASEMVLNTCSQWYDIESNKIQIISQSVKSKMNAAIVEMAESSLRTLCIAYRKVNKNNDFQTKDEKGVFQIQKHELVLLAILGVRDIPRKQVPSAIRKCHRAGIKVRMVTGDNIITAKAIAKDVGIIKQNDGSIVMEGADFIKLIGGVVCKNCDTSVCECAKDQKQADEEGKKLRIDTIKNGQEFDKIMDKLLVLARSRPEDKYALVTGLKERGQVVAVTGDGTNDAPALKKADVGFAMGICGTEVARQAAAIILLDDNFNSIVKAVLWGRNIYDSIRKFIQFQLTVNVVAVVCTLIGASLLKQEILSPIQMLWVNLIMDTLASLALATEAPTEQLLERKPNSKNENIVSNTMMKHILGQAVFQLIILSILIFYGEHFIPESSDSYDNTVFANHPQYKWHDGVVGGTIRSGRMITVMGSDDYETIYNNIGVHSRHFTFVFNTFVMMQIFNFMNARKIHEEINIFAGIMSNKLFIIIVFVIFILQILLITFAGSAFSVYSNYGLTVYQWLISVGFGSIALVVNFLLKLIKINQNEQSEQISEIIKEQDTDDKLKHTSTIIVRKSGIKNQLDMNSITKRSPNSIYEGF